MMRILVLISICLLPQFAVAEDWGGFNPQEPAVRLLRDGRRIRLLEDFAYTDAGGTRWIAPRRTVADGASIPRMFWAIIGGPLDGPYRNASIIHDVYCADQQLRNRHSSSFVHHNFYCGMRCEGVSKAKAAAMYWAVANFGPSWETKVGGQGDLEAGPVFQRRDEPANATEEKALVDWAQMYFEKHQDMAPEQIQGVKPYQQP